MSAQALLERIAQWRAIEARSAAASAKAKPVFEKRGQLLPRERIGLLLDTGSPWIALCSMAGYLHDVKDPERSVPGGGMIAGIGWISGTRCMVVASDSGIDAGAIQAMGLEKILRVQEIALQNKLPFVHLVESAGANLLRYRVEGFVLGGALFRNLARISAAGLPVLTVQHGSGTAGGAYMPGLSDTVIMVRGRSRAFLAGPPLLKAATGEIATEEELGGAQMHTSVSGLGEYMAEDDRHALGIARKVVAHWNWNSTPAPTTETHSPDQEALLSLMPLDFRQPTDMRAILSQLVDNGEHLEFKAGYGSATVCSQGSIAGFAAGFITNNGPIDVAGANKAAHFIQLCCQLGQPIIYLQNTTGYMVGKDSEQAGMIKHGSKMIQAVTSATVPQITIQCGASFGAGNYGMCGRGFAPRFLFSWPTAKTAVMGADQAARTMEIVTLAGLARKGLSADPAQTKAQYEQIVNMFESQSDVFVTSGMVLDDGIIDPRDTRQVLAQVLSMCKEASTRKTNPIQFSVARM
jgi:geranyl-CoA carboxylase beta subunit